MTSASRRGRPIEVFRLTHGMNGSSPIIQRDIPWALQLKLGELRMAETTQTAMPVCTKHDENAQKG